MFKFFGRGEQGHEFGHELDALGDNEYGKTFKEIWVSVAQHNRVF